MTKVIIDGTGGDPVSVHLDNVPRAGESVHIRDEDSGVYDIYEVVGVMWDVTLKEVVVEVAE